MNNLTRPMRSELYTLDQSEKQLLYYRTHPVQAVRELFDIELVWYQRITLRMIWFRRFPLLNLSRGCGKSFLMAISACLMAILYPRMKIGIMAPVFRQANFVFDYIEELYSKSDFLRRSTIKPAARQPAQSIIKFHNGSFIEALPVGDGTKIRGRRYWVLYIDEYAQMADDTIKLVIRPMLNIKRARYDNKLIVASTAYYQWNHYWTLYLLYMKYMMESNPIYGIAEFNYEDILATDDRPFDPDMEILKMQMNTMTEEMFMMENSCRFPSDSVGFISARLLDLCTPKENPLEPETGRKDVHAFYVMGVDVARAAGGDNFALTVLKLTGGHQDVVAVVASNGRTFQEMNHVIREVVEAFDIKRINIGHGGGGQTIKDLLAEKWRSSDGEWLDPLLDMDDPNHENLKGNHIVRLIVETAKKNSEMYMSLKAEMQHRRIRFPVDVTAVPKEEVALKRLYGDIIELKKELLVLQAEPSGMYHKFVVPSGFKKDRATALVLAVEAALDMTKAHEKRELRPLPIGLWA